MTPRSVLLTVLFAAGVLTSPAVCLAEPQADIGPGYSAADAPLGAASELRIEVKGRVPARCELTSPPVLSAQLPIERAGETESTFAIDCNAPFLLKVRSGAGGMASVEPVQGITTLLPYELAVAVGTDSGRRDLGWCRSSALAGGAADGCAFSASGAKGGWSSDDATAIDQTGTVRLRWRDTPPETPLVGSYSDTIIIALELRS